jgi:uncharacterized membrane protein
MGHVATTHRAALRTLTLSGSSLALVFWWQSLTPTLIPRTWTMQLGISAVCLAIGYGVGTLAGGAVSRLLGLRLPGNAIRRRRWIALATAWLLAVLVGAALWMRLQNEQRHFMGMVPILWRDAALISALSPLAGVLLVVIGRVITNGVTACKRFIQLRVPALVSVTITALLIVVLGIVLIGVLALRVLAGAERVNEETGEGIVQPDSPSVSGSSGSLVAWDTLGRMGRYFAGTATTSRELETFHGPDVELYDPVRVYVGLRSAESAAERAQLAVRELERAGGFERKVLVVWVPTGTGWMIPKAATTLEQLRRGDTAIVAIQYSFLPSVFAIFMDAGQANETGAALFDAVHARWSQLPPDRRPELVLFGKSLGTAGVEALFVGVDASTSVARMVAQTDGVLLAGPKRSNPILSQLTRQRDSGSPVWQPVFDEGRSVRFLNRAPDQPKASTDWRAPRIAYLQHPGDPATFWSIAALWWPPEWMNQPRGFDVPEDVRWFPIVSAVQAVGDMLDMLGPPPGFGHDYSTEYVKGWASVIPPDGWTDADTQRLEKFIDNIAGDDSEM